ncbi:MAG: type I restriction-modification system subunit M [Candidatus Omnitrophica bacterium]|nr:type I restriction-modification system subunit M [Candidatus Omnitrophota bacterium]MBU4467176.1 type I restriction-modification system subunit M [Candidatus Omnitrophota bacterium]MCG2707188.1 type I restriction-modification system subunit M [Candidatus Omnitrophota bacterium]
MSQLENIEAIEKRLWSAADTLRANSNYASNEYFMPVMGLVFLRHAYSRYLAVKDEIIASLPTRGGKTPELTKKDFSKKSSIFLQPKAQFDYLVGLKDSDDRAKAVINAMESIEGDYDTLRGVLPKKEYRELDNEILGQLLRSLNPEELKKVTGDVFGRIYEYFLTQFADQKAHDGGEFFTPVSLVSLIANVLEPKKGTVLDPACGSGGMFVQSARFVEKLHENPNDKLSFYGLEKNATTINLAKMNLAVHGLVGDIKKAITYYEDPHNLLKKADFVMANPPFNVDEIDADKIKNDPRLPFGLPGVNKKGKVGNGNYVWISYFYSYLTQQGRAGFVMSSQASSAGGGEAKVREKLIETGHVDIMISIRSNFFYTRTVPCELWFFNKAKSAELKDKVLMIDARNVFRKVTRKIYDFSPEQLQNILSIIWLYRGENKRFHGLVVNYISATLNEGVKSIALEQDYVTVFAKLNKELQPFLATLAKGGKQAETVKELADCLKAYTSGSQAFAKLAQEKSAWWKKQNKDSMKLTDTLKELDPFAEENNKLIKEAELMYRLFNRLIDVCLNTYNAKDNDKWNTREISNLKKQVEEARDLAVNQLKLARYFYHQAQWLTERFPKEKLRDVEGLVKLVDKAELKENDWALTPGRYVGVAPEEEDPDFDFGETMQNIHAELEDLNEQSSDLAKKISINFKKLGI